MNCVLVLLLVLVLMLVIDLPVKGRRDRLPRVGALSQRRREIETRLAMIPPWFWVLLLTLVCLMPFLNRAFFGDDTLFLKTAAQIRKHPIDFYGFDIRWFHTTSPMIENTYNPPLASYYLAAAEAVAGTSERALHIAFLLPTLAAAWGIFALAQKYCRRPVLAAAMVILTPAFLISATTLMCDVMLLAFWVWALVKFEEGLETQRPSVFVVSGLLAGLAFWTKFPGVGLIPLMTAYGLWRKRRTGWWLLAPLLPMLFIAGYEVITWKLYGHGHFLHAAAYAQGENLHRGLADKLAIGFCFMGGCFLPLGFYGLMGRTGLRPAGTGEAARWIGRALALVLFAGLVWRLPGVPAFQPFLRPGSQVDWFLTLQAALFCTAGVWLIWLAAVDAWRHQDSIYVLLALWVAGVFAFVTLLNWTVNGRSLLPMAPALAILLVRRLEPAIARARFSPGLWALPLAAAVSLGLARADANVARAERDVTSALYNQHQRPGRTVWFEGHGGFQFYLENLGAKPLDMAHPEIGPDDVVIIPNCAPGVATPNLNVVGVIDTVKYLPNRYYSTSEPSLGASFYEAVRGPLPFAIGKSKPDYCFVFARRRE